jgi:ADP-heptose:LPS heptosyltransferase
MDGVLKEFHVSESRRGAPRFLLQEDDLGIAGAVKGTAFRGVMLAERALGGASERVPLGEIKNFLMLQHATALGAVVHATPLVAALRQAVPECRIVVAASGMAFEIFRDNPGIEAVVKTPSLLKDVWGAAAELRRKNPLRGEAFATLTTVGNERTRVAMSAVLAGAANRVGLTVAPKLHRVSLDFNREISVIANNLRIVGALGHELPSAEFEPEVFFGSQESEFARRTLADAGVEQGQPVAVFVTQTSPTQRKSWRPERFRAAADFLHQRYRAHVLFVGTAAEAEAIDAIRCGLAFTTTSVAGKTSLTELTALLRVCDVGLTLDTGTMHLGRAVGLPMVIIAPAWSPPVEWLPVGDPRFRILKNLDIEAATPEYVIDEVSVDEAIAALAELIRVYPPGRRRREAAEK